jgi:aspartate/methionine/tyrosine aminotransferase
MADEVYHDNIYEKDTEFHSFRKVLGGMSPEIANSVELLSYNSISKGIMGECGLRSGYLEATNIDKEVEELMYKMKSIDLCANTIG